MRHRLTSLALVTVASAAWLVLPMGILPANAAEGNGPAQEESLIKHGLELRERSDDEGALAEFQRAYRLSSSGRALAQIALAEQALGRWVDAQTNLTQALERADDPWIARNEKLLRQALASIQGHTGSLEIIGAVAGAEILINNEKVGTFPMPAVPVPAGSVALEVRARGYLPVVRTVTILARGLACERVVLVAAPAAATIDVPQPADAAASATTPVAPRGVSPAPATTISTSPEPVASSTGWGDRKKVGAGIAAGGAASLAVGIAFQIIREQRARAFNDEHCGVTGSVITGPADCHSRYDGVQGAEKLAIAGFIGAAVLGGVGTYLFLSGGSGSGDTAATASASIGLRCVPSARLGVVCAARF
jgi:hypothetical protein